MTYPSFESFWMYGIYSRVIDFAAFGGKNSITFSDQYRDYIKGQYPGISNKNVLIMLSHSSVKHENSVVFHRLSIFRVDIYRHILVDDI
jgi:hypothetical protein